VGFHKVLNDPPTHALSPVIPPNAWHLCLTAAAGTELAVPSSGVDQNFLTPDSSLHPEGLLLHAASLRHTFVHCGRFVTAAPRRSLGSVSVPMWPANLSVRLRVVALVSRYLTNKLIRNRLLPDRRTFENQTMRFGYIIWYYLTFRPAIPESGVH
jgi:hypothetical protein